MLWSISSMRPSTKQDVNSQGDSRNEPQGKRDADPELSHKKRRLILFDINGYI